jgi:hypothetical protein
MAHKNKLSDVTNIQLSFLSPRYVETEVHRRYYRNQGLYLAALHADASMWDTGIPEWQRNRISNIKFD